MDELYASIQTRKKTEIHTKNVGAINALDIEQENYRFLLSGGADSSVCIYDLESKATVDLNAGTESLAPDNITIYEQIATIPRKFGHKYGVSGVSWWPFDNGLFVTSSFDGTVKVWDSNATEDGEVYAFELENRVYSFDISPTGSHSLVATATQHPLIRLLDLRSTSSSHTLKGHKFGSVQSVKWSPTQAHLLASGGSDGSVRLWDIRRSDACVSALDLNQSHPTRTSDESFFTETPIDDRRAHRSAINSLLWLPQGDYLVTAGCDEAIRLWDLGLSTNGRNSLVNYGPLVRNQYSQALYMCLSAAGDLKSPYLFFPSDNGQILMFDVMNGGLVKSLDRPMLDTKKSAHGVARTACVTSRGPGTVEFYSGALDGAITKWAPRPPKSEQEEDKEEKGTNDDSDSDSESDYEEEASDALDRYNMK